MTELDDMRAEKDTFFGGHPQSPLTRDQRKKFTGLHYFPENDDLRLEVKVDEFENKERFDMQTSTGDVHVFYKRKSAHFINEKVPTLKEPTLKLLTR